MSSHHSVPNLGYADRNRSAAEVQRVQMTFFSPDRLVAHDAVLRLIPYSRHSSTIDASRANAFSTNSFLKLTTDLAVHGIPLECRQARRPVTHVVALLRHLCLGTRPRRT
jgi:hypothetical protein